MIAQSSSVIAAALSPGEQLLWSGRPRGGLRLQSSDVYMIPLSALWAGFAFFWEYMVVTGGAPLFFWVWGIPFVAAGLYILVGRFFYDAALRANTYYGLTDQRAIIVSTLFGNRQVTVPLKQMGGIDLSVTADRSGTITFGTPLPAYATFARSGRAAPPAFVMIEDVRDVYDKILAAQQAAA
jgi:hypothetical protein